MSLDGFERAVFGKENILSAVAATSKDEDGKTFVSLVNEYGDDIHFTVTKDTNDGELVGFGVAARSADARDVLIKGLRFIVKTLEEESQEVDD